jgi:hypothetical protein
MAHGILALLFVLGTDVTTKGDEFVARGIGAATTVHVYEHTMVGPTIQLGRYGRTLRGSAYGAATDISWDDSRVTGLTGGAPINLAYRVEPDGELSVDGLFAGNLTHLHVAATGIHGHIGPRDFALDAHEGMFVSLFPTWLEVEIPRTLASREPGELAATLPILLAGYAGPATIPNFPARPMLREILARRKQVGGPVDYKDAFRVAPPPGWPKAPAPTRAHVVSGIGSTGSIGSSSSKVSSQSAISSSRGRSR